PLASGRFLRSGSDRSGGVAGRRRQSERVEPVLESKPRGDGLLGFGLKEADRPGGGAEVRRKRKTKSAGRRKGGNRTSKGERRARRGLFGGIGWLIRRTVYWTAVFAIIGTVGLAALVAYYWAKLPPTSEWTLPARPANVRIVARSEEH